MISSVTFALLMFITAINAVYANNKCPPDTYYDRVTERCDSCDDICVNARLQGTQAECKQLCPDYGSTPTPPTTTIVNCPTGQYYDSTVSRCDDCSVVCDNSAIQGTQDDCRLKCPQYFKAKHASKNEPSTAVIVAIPIAVTLVAVIILVSLYGLMLFCCPHHVPLWMRLERCLPCIFKGYKKPVQCTEASTPSSESPQTSLYNVSRPEVCTVLLDGNGEAFTDMQSQRQCSRDMNNT